jgi:gliding motility-associated-like protein
MKKFALLLSVIFSVIFSRAVLATDYRVTNLSSNGAGSLVQAFNDATNSAGPNRILFDIPTSLADADGKYVIPLSNGLKLWNPVIIEIDGTSQPGYICEPLIVLRGNGGGACFDGSNGVTVDVKGFIIQNWEQGFNFHSNTKGSIKTCWIGLNNAGTAAYTSPIKDDGIFIGSSCSDFTIGGPAECDRNIISNTLKNTTGTKNERGAITINELGARGSTIVITNNYLGTDKTGTIAIPNGANLPLREMGIKINRSHSVSITKNIISNTTGNGIWVLESNNGVITGNTIGLDKTGLVPMGNKGAGIRADKSSGIVIGGTTAAERNIVSANGGAEDSRNCGANQWGSGTDGSGGTCAVGPCEVGCPAKYDATLQCGIYFTGVTNSFIRGNYIGTDITGNSTGTNNRMGNLYAGIKFEDGSVGNTIGGPDATYRNIIGGNGFDIDPARRALNYEYKGHGIQLNKANVQSITISNNHIGVGADGTSAVGNRQDGISLLGSSNNTITQNVIGDNAFGIFGQSDFQSGLNSGQPANNTITGNFIGTDATGLIAIGNGTRNKPGIVVDGDGGGIGFQHGSNNNIIGGSNATDRNIISGNRNGILFRYEAGNSENPPMTNSILGNYIGVDITGEKAMPNTGNGILITDGANKNIIGGVAAGAANVISGNGSDGIDLFNGDNNSIFGNRIGVSATSAPLANNGDGIKIQAKADDGSIGNIIGGPLAGQANIIANNTGNGISILDAKSINNSITRNSISCNALRGIELNGVGNDNFAAPVIHSNSTDELLLGEAPANSYIEIFRTDACGGACIPGNKKMQGQTYVGSTIANAAGEWSFTQPTPGDYTLFTATASKTATTPLAAAAYNTSEFSSCINVCIAVSSVIITAPEFTICSTDPIPAFTATATGGVPRPLIFEWYKEGTDSPLDTDIKTLDTDTISVFTPKEAGTYNVSVSGTIAGCAVSAAAKTLVINEQPSFTISPASATDICLGESVDFKVKVVDSIAGTYTYDWSSVPAGQPLPVGAGSSVSPSESTDYTVVVTSPQGCKNTSAVIPITVNPLPNATFTASGPLDFCEIVDSVTLRAVKDANYSYQWKNGSSNIASPEGINDSLVVKASGSYTVVVTNTVTGCQDSTATSTDVTVFESPTLTMTPNGNTNSCIGSEIPIVVTGTGDFAWYINEGLDSDSIGTTYLAKVDGTYKVTLTDANGCKSSASVSVLFNDDKIAFIRAAANEFCENDSVKIEITTPLISNTKWYFNNVLIAGATGLEYYAKQAGSYRAYVETSVGCKDTSDAVSINMNQNPVLVELKATTLELCADDTVTISATAGSGVGPYEYSWTPVSIGTDQSSFKDVPADTVTYSLVVTDSNGCFSDKGDITVNVKARPIADPLSADANGICFGDSTELNARPSGGSGAGYTFLWSPSASLNDITKQNPTANPTIETIYTVVVTDDANCSSDEAFVTVSVLSNPIISGIVAADSICFAESFDLSANISPASGNYIYKWFGNGLSPDNVANPTATPSVDGSLVYRLVVTDESGCNSDTLDHLVKVNEKPTTPVILSADAVVCFGDSVEIQIDNSNLANYTIDWFKDGNSFVSNVQPLFVKQDGSYKVVITHKTTECKSDLSNEVVADILPEPSALTISGAGNFCDYEIGQSLKANFDPKGFNYTIAWFKDGVSVGSGSELPFKLASDSGSYRAEITYNFNGENCPYESASDAEVKFRPIPVIEANSDPSGVVCAGNEVQLQAKVIRTSFENVNTYPDHNLYEFTWAGEFSKDSLDINFEEKDTISIKAQYKRYIVSVTNSNSCSAYASVLFPEFVDVRLTRDTLDLCLNSTESVITIDSSTTRLPYAWTFENNPQKYTKISSFNLDSSVVFVNGVATKDDRTLGEEYYYLNVGQCAKIDSMLIRVHPLPVVSLVADLDTMCVATEVNLFATADKGTPYESTARTAKYNYSWYYFDSTAAPSMFVQFNENDLEDTTVNVKPFLVPEHTYYVTVVDSMGCAMYDSVVLHPQHNQNLVIPNLITPNGDNKNDVLVIKDKDTGVDIFPGATMQVYNRWGQAVYRSESYQNNWGGQNCTEGVYYYTLDAGCGKDEYKGWVQIMSNEN